MRTRTIVLALLFALVALLWGIPFALVLLFALALVVRSTRTMLTTLWQGLTYEGTLRTNPLVNNRFFNYDLNRLIKKL